MKTQQKYISETYRVEVSSSQRTRSRRPLACPLRTELLEDRCLLSAQFSGIPEWSPVGPVPIAPSIGSAYDDVRLWSGSGAIGAMALHPTDPGVMYVGSVNGGIWKTENATFSRGDGVDNDGDGVMDEFDLDEVPHWTALTDDFSTPIGALAFDPSDTTHQTVWAGNAHYSSLGREGMPRGGLLRTSDGGATWTELGRATFQNVNVESIVPTEIVTPTGQLVLAATSGGLWRSANGGQTWMQVRAGNATGLVRDPSATDRFFVAIVGQGILRSAACQANHSDCGTVWNAVNNNADLVTKLSGAQRIGLAATTAGSGSVFAATVAAGITGVFETANAGGAWDEIDVPPGRTTIEGANPGVRHFGMAADPNNQHRVFVSGFRRVAVGDGQTDTWTLLSPLEETVPGIDVLHTNGWLHDDVRGLALDLDGDLLMVSDGGIYRINDPFDDAERYAESINGDLQITETNSTVSLAYDSLSNVLVLGTQDVSTVMQVSSGSSTFREQTSGDGNSTAVEVDTGSSTSYRYFASNNWTSMRRARYDATNQLMGNAENVQWAATADGARYSGLTRGNDAKIGSNPYAAGFPFVLNDVTPSRLLLGTGNGLYESSDRGDTVVDITPGGVNRRVTALAYGGRQAGTPNADVIYAGADNQMWLRTSATAGFGQPLAAYSGGMPMDIVLDPFNWQEAYVLDNSSRIWRTTNAGGNWTDVTLGAGLPALDSIEFVRIGGTPVLLAGGEGGVFRRINPAIASHWSEFGRGLPNVTVKDVVYDATDRVLFAGTLGRGVWEINNADATLPVVSTLTVSGDLTDYGFPFPNRPDLIRIDQNATHDDRLDIFVNHVGGGPAEYSIEHAAVEVIDIDAMGGDDFLQVDYLPAETSLNLHGGVGRDVFYVASDDVHSVIEMNGDADPDWFNVTPNRDADLFVIGGPPAAPTAEGDTLKVTADGPFNVNPGPQPGDGFVEIVQQPDFNLIRYFQVEEVVDGPDWRPDVWEPNDAFGGAADLVAGSQTETNLTIHGPSNDDWFAWTATGGSGSLAIDLFFDDELGDVDMQLFDATQTFLASATSSTDDEHLVWSATEGQRYYLRVYGYQGATHPNYSLKINWPYGFPDDGLEQNDSFGQAYNLGVGDQTRTGLAVTPIPGSEFASDEDWYRWTAKVAGVLTVDAKFLHALGNLDLELYNSSQVLLDSSTSTSDNEQVTAFVMGGQTYYIRVFGLAGATNPNYELVVNGPEIPPDLLYGSGNNTAQDAKDLGAGELTIGDLSIHQPGEDDWFVWRADADSVLTVDVTFEHDLGDLDVELLDADLTRLGLSDGTGDSERISYDVKAGQSYFIRVYGFSGATNTYTLEITWPPGILPDAFEPNDAFAAAFDFGKGDQRHEALTIHPVGEFQSSDDWYRWKASTDGLLEVSVLFLHAAGDVDMALYDSGQTLLASSASSSDNEVLLWQVEAAAEYYLRVYGYEGARNADYDLIIDGPDILQDVFEPNNSRADAYIIGMGDQVYEGLTLHAPDNEDWYLWTAPVSGTLTVDVRFAHVLGDVDVHLYDAAGELRDASTSSDDGELVSTAVEAGDGYYVRIFGFDGATNPSYDLSIDGPDVTPDAFEPNDSLEMATVLTGNNPVLSNLTIHEPGNSDWFAWTAEDDGALAVEVHFAHELGDVDLELYDQEGNPLAESTSTTDSERLSWGTEVGQTYFFRVFGASVPYVPALLRGSSITIQSSALNESYSLELSFTPAMPALPGDYNANGRVEQADLDLVLLNWGHPAAPPPEGWINDLPQGVIDQAELDGVLLNWGSGLKFAGLPSAEPAPLMGDAKSGAWWIPPCENSGSRDTPWREYVPTSGVRNGKLAFGRHVALCNPES